MNRLIKFLILTIGAIAIACGTVQAVSADSNESKVVRVGFFAFDGYHMIDEEGHRSGYGYEYLQRTNMSDMIRVGLKCRRCF